MSDKKVIRVVKRDERAKASTKSKKKNAPKTARDMVTTVTSWVNDFQRQRRDETAEAIESLVRARRQLTES
jgi:formylglycine-generating enzyme required for sulfatase activity